MRNDPFVRHFVRRTVRRDFAGCSPCNTLQDKGLRRHANKRTAKRTHTFRVRTVRIQFAGVGVVSGSTVSIYERGEQTNAKTRTPPHTPQGRALALRRRALGWERACEGSSPPGIGTSPPWTRRRAAGTAALQSTVCFPGPGFPRPGHAPATGAYLGPIRPEYRHVGQTCAPRGQPLGIPEWRNRQ